MDLEALVNKMVSNSRGYTLLFLMGYGYGYNDKFFSYNLSEKIKDID